MGPLPLLVCVNDLLGGLESYLNMFVDDAKIIKGVKNGDKCIILQGSLNNIQSWSGKWMMSFNPVKCKVMRIGKKKGRLWCGYC